MNTPVSFELAKILHNKGIFIYTRLGNVTSLYNKNGNHVPYTNFGVMYSGLSDGYILAPYMSNVIMWLYEKHGIWIGVFSTDDVLMFSYKITSKQGHNYSPNYHSPTGAYEAAIEYCLINLI